MSVKEDGSYKYIAQLFFEKLIFEKYGYLNFIIFIKLDQNIVLNLNNCNRYY